MSEVIIKKIGHACVQFFCKNKSVIFDPWFGQPVNYGIFYPYPKMVPPTNIEMSSVKAIHISHIHDDHLQKESLEQFPKNIPIYIFKSKRRQFFERIYDFGFKNIIEISPGETVAIDDNFSITLFPKFPENGTFDSSCVLTIAGKHFYLSNDCIHSDLIYKMISRMFLNFDGAFIGYTGITASEACVDYSNCAEFLPSFENKPAPASNIKQVCSHIEQIAENLKPKWISPYASDYRFRNRELIKYNPLFSTAEDILKNVNCESRKIILNSGDYLINDKINVASSKENLNFDLTPLPSWIESNCPPCDFDLTFEKTKNYFLELFRKKQNVWTTPMSIEIKLLDEQKVKSLYYVFDGNQFYLNEKNLLADLVLEYQARAISDLIAGRWTLNAFHRLFLHKAKWNKLKYGQMSILNW